MPCLVALSLGLSCFPLMLLYAMVYVVLLKRSTCSVLVSFKGIYRSMSISSLAAVSLSKLRRHHRLGLFFGIRLTPIFADDP